MLLTKFLDTISKFVPGSVLSGKEAALAELDPHKIYVENVRSLLGISYQGAVDICEAAVRQGVFRRAVEVLCPDGAVAASADTEADLPPTVRCWQEKEDGRIEEVELPTPSLAKIAYYSLRS